MKPHQIVSPAPKAPGAPRPAAAQVRKTDPPDGSAPAQTETLSATQDAQSPGDAFLAHLINFFTSLRLTVVCLFLGLVLVFWGTLAQVDLGLYKAQNEFFRSFIVFWGPKGAGWKIPVFPGGYLVGGVLVINLVASHYRRFKFSKDKAGIWMVHFGLILLLLGQLGTDLLSRESSLHLREGEARNYSETDRTAELAISDITEPDLDKVVAIPQWTLMRRSEIRHPELPFVVRVKQFCVNSLVESRPPGATTPPAATQGVGVRAQLRELPHVTEMNKRDVPSAVIEIVTPQASLGSWLVTEFISGDQTFTVDKRAYQIAMRPRRYYKPYSIQLQQFRHDLYPGTDIPKNFSSRVLLQRPDTGESREVLIYMNNPLRYGGETYYQSGFDEDNRGTILQVVHNPSWLTPYFSCLLVGLGLVVHFVMHLLGFTFKRKTT
jgi:hypothetical protein